jgi:hypothetical protein
LTHGLHGGFGLGFVIIDLDRLFPEPTTVISVDQYPGFGCFPVVYIPAFKDRYHGTLSEIAQGKSPLIRGIHHVGIGIADNSVTDDGSGQRVGRRGKYGRFLGRPDTGKEQRKNQKKTPVRITNTEPWSHDMKIYTPLFF